MVTRPDMRTKAAKLSAPNVWLDWKALIVARKHGDNILESTGGQQQRHLDQLWIKIIALDQKFNRSHVVLKAWSTQCRFFLRQNLPNFYYFILMSSFSLQFRLTGDRRVKMVFLGLEKNFCRKRKFLFSVTKPRLIEKRTLF